ncbi:hypothetical protein JB92DRAFT_3086545 [Gautieria morchelliformis]|nr:hypothetical protein JB92DRAFT_3086545 [Gautieria morchelliformis]
MRTCPTRREVIFILAFVISFVLFLQFGLGSLEAPQDSGADWSRRITIPWVGGNSNNDPGSAGAPKSPLEAPSNFGDFNGDARESAFVWNNGKVPTTEIRMHVPGWTVFDKLYLFNGTVFVVTDDPKSLPDRMLLTSSGFMILNDPEDVARRTPTDNDMQIISPAKAAELFGSYASRMDGTSFLVNDPPQFIAHYYHWSAELFFGLWKAYSTLDPGITSDGHTKLPAPRRLIMVRVPAAQWRDYAAMNQWVTRGSFPSVSLEFQEDWVDRASMAHPFLLERVVFADRAAADHNPSVRLLLRSNAELFKLPGSPHWWSTIRNNLIDFAGGDPQEHSRKVITYISRQGWGRRMLLPQDHDRLVKALEGLRDQYGYEVNIVNMDKLTRQEQFRLAGRTTILMGVHGNGLTSLLWMWPSKRATVMEFFYPGGFAHDYEWTTRALGMRHYGFWGNEYFTSPDLPPINYPDGFQGNEIPIDGSMVAQLCHERLSLPE